MDDRQRILNDLIDEGVRHWRYWRPHGKETRGERQVRKETQNKFIPNIDSTVQGERLTSAEYQFVAIGVFTRIQRDQNPVVGGRRALLRLNGWFWMTVVSLVYLALSAFFVILFLSNLDFLLRILLWWWNSVKTIGGLL